jgi:hypothetical protein
MHRPWNMAAELIGCPPTHVENDQAWLSQSLLKLVGVDQ